MTRPDDKPPVVRPDGHDGGFGGTDTEEPLEFDTGHDDDREEPGLKFGGPDEIELLPSAEEEFDFETELPPEEPTVPRARFLDIPIVARLIAVPGLRIGLFLGLALAAALLLRQFVVTPYLAPPAAPIAQTPAIPPPLLMPIPMTKEQADAWEAAHPYRTQDGSRFSIDPPPPTPFAEGVHASEVAAAPLQETLGAILCRRAGVPCGGVTVKAQSEKPASADVPPLQGAAPLYDWTVAQDRTIRAATPKTILMAGLLVAVALMLGFSHLTEIVWRSSLQWWMGYGSYLDEDAGRFVAAVAYPAALLALMCFTGDWSPALFLFLAVASIPLRTAGRIRMACLAALALSIKALFLTPIVAPAAELAAEYGRLGIYTWDIIGLCAIGFVALCVLRPFRRLFTRTVVVHATIPLVQDVRIVDDRSLGRDR